MRKRIAISICLLLTVLLLNGCWDRTEINDLAFILTTAVDLEQDGTYRLTVMVPLPGHMGGASGGGGGTAGNKSYYIDSEVGETFRECQLKLQKRMSRRMFLAHRRTILIGEDLAKKGIRDLYDATPRSPENRMTTYLVVTKGKAYDMIKSTPQFERFSSEAIRELIKSRAVLDINFKDIGIALSLPGVDPIAVYMAVKESEKNDKPSKEVELKGYAQFKDDKMVGTLENDAALGLALVKGQKMIVNSIMMRAEDGNMMSARIYDAVTKIDTKLSNQQVQFKITVKVKAKLMEDKSHYDLSQTKNILGVEAVISEHVKNAIHEAIDKSLAKNVDSVQLGFALWRAYPQEWKEQFEKSWPQGLKDAKLDIEIKSQLTDTGLIYDNVTKEYSGE
jgi:spore germination protein KC